VAVDFSGLQCSRFLGLSQAADVAIFLENTSLPAKPKQIVIQLVPQLSSWAESGSLPLSLLPTNSLVVGIGFSGGTACSAAGSPITL
jgi:hypothetical protein